MNCNDSSNLALNLGFSDVVTTSTGPVMDEERAVENVVSARIHREMTDLMKQDQGDPKSQAAAVPPTSERCPSSSSSGIDEIVNSAITSAAAEIFSSAHSDDAKEKSESQPAEATSSDGREATDKERIAQILRDRIHILEERESSFVETEREMESLRGENVDLLRTVSANAHQIDAMKNEIEELRRGQICSVEDSSKPLEEENHNLKRQIVELKGFQDKVITLKAQKVESENALTLVIEHLREEKSQLEAAVQGLGNDELLAAIDRLEKETAERQNQIEIGTVLYKEALQELEVTKTQIETYKQELDSMNGAKQPLEKKVSEAGNVLYKEALDELEETKQNLNKEKVDHKNEVDRLTQQLTNLQEALDERDEKIAKGTEMYEAAIRTVEEAMSTEENLRQQIKENTKVTLAVDTSEYETRISHLQEELKARDEKIAKGTEMLEASIRTVEESMVTEERLRQELRDQNGSSKDNTEDRAQVEALEKEVKDLKEKIEKGQEALGAAIRTVEEAMTTETELRKKMLHMEESAKQLQLNYEEKITELQNSLESIRNEERGDSEHTERIATLEQEKMELEDKISKGIDLYNQALKKIEEADANEERYKAHIVAYESQLVQIKSEVVVFEDEIQSLRNEKAFFRSKLDQLMKEKNTTNSTVEKVETLEKEKSTLEEKISKGVPMYEEALAKIEEYKVAEETYHSNITVYQSQLQQIQNEMSCFDDKVKVHEREKAELQARLKQLEEGAGGDASEQVSKLLLEKSLLEDQLKSEKENYKLVIGKLEEKIKQRHKEHSQQVTFTSERSTAEGSEMKILETKLAEIEKEKAERETKYETDVTAYQTQIQKDTIAICALEERLHMMVKKTKEYQEEITRLRQERGVASPSPPPIPKMIVQQPIDGSAETLILQLRQQVHSLQAEVTSHTAARTSLEKDLAGAQARLTDITGELNEQQKQEVERVKSELECKTKEVQELQQKMVQLSSIVDQYKAELAALKKTANSKEKSSGKFKNVLNERERKIAELEDKLKKLDKQRREELKAKTEEGTITTEMTAVGAQCKGERHEDTIIRQREALGELRLRVKMLEQNRPPVPGHDQALQQIIMLKRDLAELRAGQAMAEHKKVLHQSGMYKSHPPPVVDEVLTESRSISMEDAKAQIFPVIENKHKLTATLREQNSSKSRTLHNGDAFQAPPSGPSLAWSERPGSGSPNKPDTLDGDKGDGALNKGIAQGRMFAPKPPEKPKLNRQPSPKGQFSTRERPASAHSTDGVFITNGWHEKSEKTSRAETDMERSAHIETNKSLDLSEETYLSLLRGVASALEMDSVDGLRSLAHIPADERRRLAQERESACATLTNKINALKERLIRKDELLSGYDKDLAKLRKAELLADDRRQHMEGLSTELRQKTEELQYMRESLERSRQKLEQEKRLNTAIKKKKTYHLENEKSDTPSNKHSCIGKDQGKKVTSKQKNHIEMLRKKNYELKVLKNELETRDRDLASTKRSLSIMKEFQPDEAPPTSQGTEAADKPAPTETEKNEETQAETTS